MRGDGMTASAMKEHANTRFSRTRQMKEKAR